MSDRREQVAEHLMFFAELGVTGYRKDSVWSTRLESAADLKVSATNEVGTTNEVDTTNEAVSQTNSDDTVDRSADLQVGPRPTTHNPEPKAEIRVSDSEGV